MQQQMADQLTYWLPMSQSYHTYYLKPDLRISGTEPFPKHPTLRRETGDLGPREMNGRDCAAVLATGVGRV